jgi:hypothetical protein
VTLIFWIFLSDSLPENSFPNIILENLPHILNLVIPLLDLICSDAHLKWFDVFFPIITLVIYSITIVTSKYTFGLDWPYPFMKQLNLFQLFALMGVMLVAVCLFYALTSAFIYLRNCLYKCADDYDVKILV